MQLYSIDFEEIYTDQSWYQSRKNKIHDMNIILPYGVNGYCSQEAYDKLTEYCSNIGMPALTFLGSGNYHYLTYFLLEKFNSPYSLVLFDFHSDIQLGMCKDLLSCGNWVKFALEDYPDLKQVFVVGLSEQYVPENYNSYGKEVHFITEEEVAKTNWLGKLQRRIDFPIYISIDKDVFQQGLAFTNWDQGTMEQKDMKAFFKEVAPRHEILGGDICGECSKNYTDPKYIIYQGINNEINQELTDYFTEDYIKYKCKLH